MQGAAERLYLITDGGGDSGAVTEKIGLALEAGIRLIQLREKGLSARELLRLARQLRASTRKYGARLIINDRLDIALLSEADGVHLGQRSCSAGEARKLIGKGKIIVVSAHSLKEARKAEGDGADFITLGPVFNTPSKAAYGEPVGIEMLKSVCDGIDIPVYAIGGIKVGNVKEVLSSGARGIAVISAIMGSSDIKKSAAEMLKCLADRST